MSHDKELRLREVLGEIGEEKSFTEGLNPEQRAAVEHLDGPLLILAGAGSGKTRVITHRIARLVSFHHVPLRNILAVTFTNKAAREMLNRVYELLGQTGEKPCIGTFHSLMVRILRSHAEAIGFPSGFAILDRDEQTRQLKRCLEELNLSTSKESDTYRSRISALKARMISPQDVEEAAGNNQQQLELARVYAHYQKLLMENHSMDFDDILYYAVRLFELRDDLLQIYQQRFRYIMVDEYQDTNHVQYRIVELLSARHHNICVVGDDDQSIYSFRGADMENILSFEHSFPDCKVIKLEQNYRSTGRILEAANRLISRNKRRKAKALWTAAGEGERVEYRECPDQYAEAQYVVSEIEKIKQGGGRYSDVAILYRNNALTRHLEKALTQAAVPFAIYGGLRFLDRREIRDLCAYLSLIVDPRNDLAFRRVINVPRRGIGDKTLSEIELIAGRYGRSFLEVCYRADHFDSLGRSAERLTNFARLILNFRKRLLSDADGLADFVALVQEKTGLEEWYLNERNTQKGEDRNNRLENLREFLSDIVEYVEHADETVLPEFSEEELALIRDEGEREALLRKNAERIAYRRSQSTAGEESEVKSVSQNFILLSSYLEHAALSAGGDNEDQSEDKVSLSTVHSAKGLEFSHVFLVGFEEEIFPSAQSLGTENGLEEERRLAYVAITRAKEKLRISSVQQRLIYGRTSYARASRFLGEIPEDCLQKTLTGTRALGERRSLSESLRRAAQPEHLYSFDRAAAGGQRAESRAGLPFAASALAPGQGASLRPTAKKRPISEDKTQYLKPEDLYKGRKVIHARYGEGTVLELLHVAGDAIVLLSFGQGERRFVVKNAKLRAK